MFVSGRVKLERKQIANHSLRVILQSQGQKHPFQNNQNVQNRHGFPGVFSWLAAKADRHVLEEI